MEMMQRIGYRILRDNRYKYYDSLCANLRLRPDEMKRLQLASIVNLVDYAYNNSIFYRELIDPLKIKPSDIRCKEDLMNLPIITKSDIKANISAIKTNDTHGRYAFEVTSGGSSGNQAVIYKSHYFEQYSRAAMLRNNSLIGWNPQDKAVWIWGAPYEHQRLSSSYKARIGIILNNRLLFNAYNYNVTDFHVWVSKINKFKPKVLYGYSSIIAQFSKFLLAEEIELKSITTVVSTTEKLRERELIKAAFRCRVYDQYGCREIPSIGIEIDEGLMVVSDDTVAMNTDPDGNVFLTALHSYGFPLINYKVGDVVSVSSQVVTESKKLPFSTMKLEIGRETDNFINSFGSIISSSALATYISTFKLPLKEYQIIQNSYKEFLVRFVLDDGYCSNSIYSVFQKILQEYFGESVTVNYEAVSFIPVERSGKKLLFRRSFKL